MQNESQNKGLIGWFANNHVAANIMMFLFIIGGIVSISGMRTETFPTIDPKIITVSVAYPGATPYEIADSITNRVEEVVIGIDGVKKVFSTAQEGYGSVVIEMEDFVDTDDVYSDVETNVNSLSDFPPEDAERTRIVKTKITSKVVTLALHGNVEERVVKYWADTIENQIKQLKNISLTNITGVRNYQISVEIPENSLRKYNLSLQDVGNAIQRFSSDIPAGTIESSKGDILLRIQEKRYTGEEFGNVILKTLPNGSSLKIKDIGNVIDGFEDTNIISKYNGERAAFIEVLRSENQDTLEIAGIVKDYLQDVKLPSGLSISIQKDETLVLKDRISLMMRNAILGFMMVFLILLLFLDLKLAFWTSIAIPVSFLGGMMIVDFLGYSLNMISLFALIVVLGIVVDDAIIAGESIFEEQARNPNNPNSVMKGIRSVLAPVTVGVTTTMAAFAPLIFSTGTFGQIVSIIPIVVIPILFISLLEVYFILPSHLSKPGNWSKGIMSDIRDKVTHALNYTVEKFVIPVAKLAVSWRYVTIAAFLAIAIITAGMMKSGLIRFVFFPQIERDDVVITVTMPVGTSFNLTKETVEEIEDEIENVRNEIDGGKKDFVDSIYESVATTIGQTSSGGAMGVRSSNASNNVGQITVKLVPSDFREQSAFDIESMIRERVEGIPNIEELDFKSSLIGNDADIEIDLRHPEEKKLIQAAEELKNKISRIKGAKEVTDSFKEGKTEYIFKLTKEGLASFEGEGKENQRDLGSLGKNMLIALMIMFVLLGAQLRSYIQPLVIMMAIPFGFVGAVWGHFILGYDLTFISMFGVVALSGVVVNDSVVLVDYKNKMLDEGMEIYDATIEAIKRRFRPILLTTLTTSLGLLPMLLETSIQARFLIPMVVSLATGIIFATFVILLLVPSLLMVLADIKRVFVK